MGLEKITRLDKIEIIPETGHIQIRYAVVVQEDGVDVGVASYHRTVLAPGEDSSELHPMIQAVAEAVHTPEVVSAFQARVKSQIQTGRVV